MLGDIFGRNAGDIAAEEVLCLFLLPLPLFLLSILTFFVKESCEPVLASALRGVLVALSFADLTESVGSSCCSFGVLDTSICRPTGRAGPVAASGRLISSIGSPALFGVFLRSAVSGDKPSLLGSLIRVAGVTGLLGSDCCDVNKVGDLSDVVGTGGGRIDASESGSGDTESSLL